MIYVLFRPHTLFFSLFVSRAPLARFSFPGDDFVLYFLPDVLWGSALCFFLFFLHLPPPKKAILLSLTAFVFGCFWEELQLSGIVSGTGDLLDCLAYGAGSTAALCIYHFRKRRKT